MKYKDYYKSLDLDKNASKEDIKKAYRRLAKKYHPDANPGDKAAEEKFKDINEAYEVLSDEEKKHQYDNFGSQHQFQGGADFDPSQFGFAKGGNTQYQYYSAGDSGFSDFFNVFFGNRNDADFENIFNSTGGGRGRAAYSERRVGEDQEVPITISLLEGLKGAHKQISIKKEGKIKRLNIKIPMGIQEGERIRLKGQGKPGIQGGRSGDLYLKFKLDAKNFQLNGSHITLTVPLLPWEAALGISKNVQTLDETILVKIPPMIQSGKKIKLTGKGYIDKNGHRGDLYISISIKNPNHVTQEMKILFEKMKETYEGKVEE
ncbi:MAG: DnaJ C-terminal domain-containing protein [Eubacteriales bacterium]